MKQHPIKALLILLLLLFMVGLGADSYGNNLHWPSYIGMMLFYGLIFGMGLWAARKEKGTSLEDSILAGRSLPLWISAFTMCATWVGGGYINGTAEYTYGYGLSWVQAPWGYGLSLIIGGLFFARKMRAYRFRTLLDPLEQRFGVRISTLLFFPALTGEIFWSAAILTALGTTFGTILGLEFSIAIILSAIIAIAYTAIGGLWAVAMTDVFQFIVLIGVLLLVIPFAVEFSGGYDEMWAAYEQKMGTFSDLFPAWGAWNDPAWGDAYWNWWDTAFLLILGGIPWQVYFQRVLAAKNERTAMILSILAGVGCILAAIPAIWIGAIGSTADWSLAGAQPPEDAALILPYVLRDLTPLWLATLGLGAIAAAVMSSVDSSILSASSMASWNIFRPLFRPDASEGQLRKVLKRCIWIIGMTATLLALQVQSVYVLWYLCADFVYVLLFPAFFCALFDPKANWIGVLWGFGLALFLRLGGGEAALGLEAWLPYPMIDEQGICLFPFRTMAMLTGLLSILIISRFTQRWAPAKALVKVET